MTSERRGSGKMAHRRNNTVSVTPRAGESAGRWFNETLIKEEGWREGGGGERRPRARVETFALAINATVHPPLTAPRRGSATIYLPREMERVPAGDYTCVT